MSDGEYARGSGSLTEWVAHVFDHPVEEPASHGELDATVWDDPPERVATLLAETFEDSGRLLAGFSNAQLSQGFWWLVSPNGSEYLYVLGDLAVPLPLRLRVLRSFVPLFEQVMAGRCSPHPIGDKARENPLNGICFMWWDVLPVAGYPEDPARAEFDAEVLRVLRRLLEIPHDACRESALHGLGEWHGYYPEQTAEIVDDFLGRTPELRPELLAYALRAREGTVQ